MNRLLAASWMALLLTIPAIGCGKATSGSDLDAVAHQRDRFLLKTEPGDAMTVLDLRDVIQGEQEVTLIGQIGGVAEPWADGRAAFVMADPSILMETEGSGHGEACDCPFCSKKPDNNRALARVNFTDEDGRVLPVDARQLFGLEDRQTVVVHGRARVDELGGLVVAAKGLYIRR